MRIIRGLEETALRDAVLAIGDFDGVHLGHRAVIAEAKRQARRTGSPFAVLSAASGSTGRLTPTRLQARLLAEQGVETLILSPVAHRQWLTPDSLCRDFAVRALVADESFARDSVSPAMTRVDSVRLGKEEIDAPRIAQALRDRLPGKAAQMLGYYWRVEARVRHGDARGRLLGFPTANMHLHGSLTPAFGIYAVRASVMDGNRVASRHDGVANFGIRPMYHAPTPLLETHLLDFNGDLYGKYLSVELISWLRPEANFSSVAQLIAQMNGDKMTARNVLDSIAQPEIRRRAALQLQAAAY